MLYLSLWGISLPNLVATTFTKRLLPTNEAASLIAQARAEDAFMGVSMSDLGAPYEKRRYQDHVDVCQALRARGVALTMEDFFNESFCNPLQFARIGGGHRLMVVDCTFSFTPTSNHLAAGDAGRAAETPDRVQERISKLFTINAASLEFHLFEERTT